MLTWVSALSVMRQLPGQHDTDNESFCYSGSVASLLASGFFVFFKESELMEGITRVSSLPLLLSIPEVAKILGLGRTKVYELIAREGLPVVRFGKAVRVSPTSLQQWLERRQSA